MSNVYVWRNRYLMDDKITDILCTSRGSEYKAATFFVNDFRSLNGKHDVDARGR